MVAATLARFFSDEPDLQAALMAQANRPVKSRSGVEVGAIRVTEGLV